MPKIRGIKPDYWTDEDIVDLTIPARLLFIGLWSYACDNGHLQDKSKQIKMRLLPGDDCNVAELLRELEGKGRIHRSAGWITVPNFAKHQKPDKRFFQTCEAPGCAHPKNSQPETRGGLDVDTSGTRGGHTSPIVGTHGDVEVRVSGVEGDGEVEGDTSRSLTLAEPIVLPLTSQTLVAEWIDHCSGQPPGRVVGHVAKEVKTMLEDGIAYERVRHGLAEWNARGLHPSTLPSVVHEMANKRTPQTNRQAAENAMWERSMERAIEREREMGIRP